MEVLLPCLSENVNHNILLCVRPGEGWRKVVDERSAKLERISSRTQGGQALVMWQHDSAFDSASCAGKPSDWHTRKVIDSTNSSQTALNRVYVTFRIEEELYTYLAHEPLRHRWFKPATVRGSGPVKFAVVDDELFMLNKNGKEHEMESSTKASGKTKATIDCGLIFSRHPT